MIFQKQVKLSLHHVTIGAGLTESYSRLGKSSRISQSENYQETYTYGPPSTYQIEIFIAYAKVAQYLNMKCVKDH